MDTLNPGSSPPDKIAEALREAQGILKQSVAEGGLTKDPLRWPLYGLAITLGSLLTLYEGHADQLQNTSRDLEKHAASIKALSLDPKVITDLTSAAARGADRRAQELARAYNWRTLGYASLGLLSCVIVSGFSCFWWGWSSASDRFAYANAVFTDIATNDPKVAVGWANLMRWNGYSDLLGECKGNNLAYDQAGRTACRMMLWITPAKPTPVATQ